MKIKAGNHGKLTINFEKSDDTILYSEKYLSDGHILINLDLMPNIEVKFSIAEHTALYYSKTPFSYQYKKTEKDNPFMPDYEAIINPSQPLSVCTDTNLAIYMRKSYEKDFGYSKLYAIVGQSKFIAIDDKYKDLVEYGLPSAISPNNQMIISLNGEHIAAVMPMDITIENNSLLDKLQDC